MVATESREPARGSQSALTLLLAQPFALDITIAVAIPQARCMSSFNSQLVRVVDCLLCVRACNAREAVRTRA
jgi:hypothetical protein